MMIELVFCFRGSRSRINASVVNPEFDEDQHDGAKE